MARAKVIYGTPTTQKNFWAYAVDRLNKAVIVRCEDRESAIEEMERMRMSDAVKVGYTAYAVDELEMRKRCRERGWKLEVIR